MGQRATKYPEIEVSIRGSGYIRCQVLSKPNAKNTWDKYIVVNPLSGAHGGMPLLATIRNGAWAEADLLDVIDRLNESRFIIVKYANRNHPTGKADAGFSVAFSPSWIKVGCTKTFYLNRAEGSDDLRLLRMENPDVEYGIVEVAT